MLLGFRAGTVGVGGDFGALAGWPPARQVPQSPPRPTARGYPLVRHSRLTWDILLRESHVPGIPRHGCLKVYSPGPAGHRPCGGEEAILWNLIRTMSPRSS